MPVYSLKLSTQNGGTNYTSDYNPISLDASYNKSAVGWYVNWNNLFNNENLLAGKKCQVRYRFSSERWSPSSTTDWNNYTGYLTLNLSSQYQQNGGGSGLVLDIINPVYIPQDASGQNVFSVYNQGTLNASTGININVPTGSSLLEVRLFNDTIYPTLIPLANSISWSLFLTFELY